MFRVAPDVRYRLIDDEAIVVRQNEGDVLVFNDVAARVLQLVSEGLTPQQISDRAVEEYDAPEATIRDDVVKFLDELESLNVVEPSPPAEPSP
ncbi:PqqD family protein [Acidobacteriota bacterium]